MPVMMEVNRMAIRVVRLGTARSHQDARASKAFEGKYRAEMKAPEAARGSVVAESHARR